MKKEILQIQQKMQQERIDYYLVPTSDYHHSEYVSDYFKCREYASGFTGSAGTLLISSDRAWLWTDGRYYLQAEEELSDSDITLMKDGSFGVPTVNEFLQKTLTSGQVLAFDGRLYTANAILKLNEYLKGKNIKLLSDCDLFDDLWKSRPEISKEPIYIYPESYCGTSIDDKLSLLRNDLTKKGVDGQLINGLMDIAWLFNLRGNDVAYTPVFLSYTYVTRTKAILFIHPEALTDDTKKYLDAHHVEVMDYDAFDSFVPKIQNTSLLVDLSDMNYRTYEQLSDSVQIFLGKSMIHSAKIVKSDTEIAHTKECHIRDGVFMTKFLHWVKETVKKRPLSEMEIANYIDDLRLSDSKALDLSFETISAYAEHGAIVHYTASVDSNKEVLPKGMILVDSGGQYLDGTTDITRTIVLGPITDEEKRCYTTVCRCMLHLANAKFLTGCRGSSLDCIAREPLWEQGMDYRHGTGHGVGHLLSVHEGPNNFRFRVTPTNLDAVLLPGMITTDEPGYYADGKFGIRIENELLCKKWKQNAYGQFLCFEPLTYVPIDLDAIDPNFMNSQELEWLNEYHANVYKKLSPFFSEEDRIWLAEYTRPLEK